MVELFSSRSGRPSMRAGGVAFHSPYDPEREASQFVDRFFKGPPPSLVILLGEGLGYATIEIRKRYPAARVIPLFYSTEIFLHRLPEAGPAWHPGESLSLEEFLLSAVGELDLEGFAVVEWPAAARLFPELSRRAHLAVGRAVREANGSFMTTTGMGRLWLRNSLLNFLSLTSVLKGRACDPEAPILVAASGPGLEKCLPLIREKRGAFDLWALPSSLSALKEAGVFPDLVVMTDPGHWSISHISFSGIECPVAMPLSAARGTWRFPAGVFLLSQPSFFETDLLERAGVNAAQIPPHGTVAATALSLALASSGAGVIVAGLDLCYHDILSHARPNLFDRLLFIDSSRLSPHYSLSYRWACGRPFSVKRSRGGFFRVPRSHDAYAGWLGSLKSDRLFRLGSSPVPIASMASIDAGSVRALADRASGGPTLRLDPGFPSSEKRKSLAGVALDGWQKILAEGLRAVVRTRDPSLIARHPLLLSLAYHTEAQLLMETRRKARLGDVRSACDLAVTLLERGQSFLRRLRSKTGV